MSGQLPATFVKGFHNEELVRRMEYRPLGNTGLKVSKIGFGAATLSGLFDSDKFKFDKEEGIRAVQEAIKSGINYIDTAPFYGQGRSEQILGEALKDVPRKAYYLATKVGRYELVAERMFDFTEKKTRESLEKSFKLLGLDAVDVLQVHDVDAAPSLDMVLNETIPVLEEYVRAGKARFIGITGYDLDILKECAERGKGRIHLMLNYARYTLLDNTLQRFMKDFQGLNVGVICAAAHALGLLSNAGSQIKHPGSKELQDVAIRGGEICKQRGVELGKLAMYHTLQLDGAATFLVGIPNRHMLQINLDAIFNGLTSNEQEVLQYLRENVFTKSYSWGSTLSYINDFK